MAKGIVFNTVTKLVLYKFDTSNNPTLNANEAVALRSDIDDILVGATYNSGTSTYTNPVQTPKDWKAEYAACTTDSQRIAKIAQYVGLV